MKEQVKRYPVTMEEVPDEDMPNGEDSIMIEEANDRDSNAESTASKIQLESISKSHTNSTSKALLQGYLCSDYYDQLIVMGGVALSTSHASCLSL